MAAITINRTQITRRIIPITIRMLPIVPAGYGWVNIVRLLLSQ